MKIRISVSIAFLLLSVLSFAQEISNVHFEQSGKQIHIYYDMTGNESYTVEVFCSTDKGNSWREPLKNVSGDVGENQKRGNGKKIIWDALTETGQLTGEIMFRIEATASFFGNTGTFIDPRDGLDYKWIRLGDQLWMAENLNYKTANSWCYDNMTTNCYKYGRLYNWKAARTACPAGWHLPSDSEWDILVDYLGARSVAGGKMKEAGTTHWESVNSGATNSSGFTALPGGYRNTDGGFLSLGLGGYWWSATEGNSGNAWIRSLFYNYGRVTRSYYDKRYGFSVRCLRD